MNKLTLTVLVLSYILTLPIATAEENITLSSVQSDYFDLGSTKAKYTIYSSSIDDYFLSIEEDIRKYMSQPTGADTLETISAKQKFLKFYIGCYAIEDQERRFSSTYSQFLSNIKAPEAKDKLLNLKEKKNNLDLKSAPYIEKCEKYDQDLYKKQVPSDLEEYDQIEIDSLIEQWNKLNQEIIDSYTVWYPSKPYPYSEEYEKNIIDDRKKNLPIFGLAGLLIVQVLFQLAYWQYKDGLKRKKEIHSKYTEIEQGALKRFFTTVNTEVFKKDKDVAKKLSEEFEKLYESEGSITDWKNQINIIKKSHKSLYVSILSVILLVITAVLYIASSSDWYIWGVIITILLIIYGFSYEISYIKARNKIL